MLRELGSNASPELLQFPHESHLPSLASPSLGISAPCCDATQGLEEQGFGNKLWSFWPLLFPACYTKL